MNEVGYPTNLGEGLADTVRLACRVTVAQSRVTKDIAACAVPLLGYRHRDPAGGIPFEPPRNGQLRVITLEEKVQVARRSRSAGPTFGLRRS
jgi:hypothetical protein